MGLTLEQLEYLLGKIIGEVFDGHFHDAVRELFWYTGYGVNLKGDVYHIDRTDGAYSFWKDEPYVEITMDEYKKLIGWEEK